MTQLFDAQQSDQRTAAIAAASQAIGQRELIVLPTDTVYGVGADAFSPQAVTVLLAAKGRSRQSPPPVLIANMQVLDALAAEIPPTGRQLAEAFWPGALTLIFNAQPSLSWDLGETHGTVTTAPADELTQHILQKYRTTGSILCQPARSASSNHSPPSPRGPRRIHSRLHSRR